MAIARLEAQRHRESKDIWFVRHAWCIPRAQSAARRAKGSGLRAGRMRWVYVMSSPTQADCRRGATSSGCSANRNTLTSCQSSEHRAIVYPSNCALAAMSFPWGRTTIAGYGRWPSRMVCRRADAGGARRRRVETPGAGGGRSRRRGAGGCAPRGVGSRRRRGVRRCLGRERERPLDEAHVTLRGTRPYASSSWLNRRLSVFSSYAGDRLVTRLRRTGCRVRTIPAGGCCSHRPVAQYDLIPGTLITQLTRAFQQWARCSWTCVSDGCRDGRALGPRAGW